MVGEAQLCSPSLGSQCSLRLELLPVLFQFHPPWRSPNSPRHQWTRWTSPAGLRGSTPRISSWSGWRMETYHGMTRPRISQRTRMGPIITQACSWWTHLLIERTWCSRARWSTTNSQRSPETIPCWDLPTRVIKGACKPSLVRPPLPLIGLFFFFLFFFFYFYYYFIFFLILKLLYNDYYI